MADKPYEATPHSRVAEKLLAARYALRKTKQAFEMSIFTEEEIRVFCKRTAQINKLEKRTGPSFRNQPTRSCGQALTKRGVPITF
jgi:predicted phage-related endonuclease